MSESERDYYTVKEVSKKFGYHPETIRRMCRIEGRKFYGVAERIGKEWRIPKSAVDFKK